MKTFNLYFSSCTKIETIDNLLGSVSRKMVKFNSKVRRNFKLHSLI